MTLNEGYSYRHVLGPAAAGHSVDSYLALWFDHSTTEEWQTRIVAGELWIDGRQAVLGEKVRPGQTLVWNRPAWIEESTPQTYRLIYQDTYLVAVDKPSGLPTLPGGGFHRNTLLGLVRKDFPTATPVHRLGRATSGIVLFALDSETTSRMHRRWPHLLKRYQALAAFCAPEDLYDIQCPIGSREHPRLGTVHAAHPRGKPARSIARVLERRDESTLFEVDIHTGRPHQIRIHLASIGHPLLGDPLYDVGGVPKPVSPGLPGDPGYLLHAKRISFMHPYTEAAMDLTAALPDRLTPQTL